MEDKKAKDKNKKQFSAEKLQALIDDMETTTFNAATVRRRMADAGIAGMLDVEPPQNTNRVDTDMPLSEV